MNPSDKDQVEAPQEPEEAADGDVAGTDTSQENMQSEARKMGWVPQSEFRGPKDQWRDAEEFVERGRTVIPIIRSQLDREREKSAALSDKLDRLEKDHARDFKRLEHMSAVALEKQRESLTDQYGARKEAAVERGDIEGYRAADQAERKALSDLDSKSRPPEDKADARTALPQSVQNTVETWLVDNRWYQSDLEMQALASVHHEKLLRDKPGLTLAENLADVRDYVKTKFPEKFSKGRANGADTGSSPVEGGGSRSSGSTRGLYAKLPSDAKAMADKQLGLYLKKGETEEKDGTKAKERWAKVYFDQPGT